MKKTNALVKSLQDERDNQQKSEFTIWINSILQEEDMKVKDLFLDLCDGQKLTRLLELVFAEKFTRLSRLPRGKTRMHHIENINKCLAFLRTKVPLPSIGAEDIVDGNHRLILGLVWTIMHGSPAKIEDAREILSTQPLLGEQTPKLPILIEPVNQESSKPVKQNNNSLVLEPEADNVLEDKSFIHTTCVLQTKSAAVEKNYIKIENAVPMKFVKEADDTSKVQLLQQKQQEADEEIAARYQDLIKKKQGDVEEDENPDVNNQFQINKQNEILHETNDINSENCPKQQVDEINESGEFNKEQLLIEQENESEVKDDEQLDLSSQNQQEKEDELKVAQFGEQEKNEIEPVQDLEIEELELHLGVKEKHDQKEENEVKQVEMKEAEDSHDKKQNDECNRKIEYLQNEKDLETEVLNEMHPTEQKQGLDYQNIVELNPCVKKELGELNKLIYSDLKHNQYHIDEESEIQQKNVEVDDEGFGIQTQETVEQPQQDNRIEKTTPEISLIDSNYDSDNDLEYDQSGTTSTPFLHELLKECNRRGLIERQLEAKEKEEKEKRDIQFYKLLEQVSKDHGPKEPENEEFRVIFDAEKHKKEQLWKQREIERLQEEAARHREEVERLEKLKYDREEEERQNQLLIDI